MRRRYVSLASVFLTAVGILARCSMAPKPVQEVNPVAAQVVPASGDIVPLLHAILDYLTLQASRPRPLPPGVVLQVIPARDWLLNPMFGASFQRPDMAPSRDELPAAWVSELRARGGIARLCAEGCRPEEGQTRLSFSKPVFDPDGSARITVSFESKHVGTRHLSTRLFALSRSNGEWTVIDKQRMYDARMLPD